jgi:hypothetical protein
MNNDIHLDQQYRKTLKVEEYDGKGSRSGGNHPMSGEPLFSCPKFGLTATSYCYSCTNFNGLKKDKKGNLGECDIYPGARERIVSQIAREQPPELTDIITPKRLREMGVRNINDNIPFNSRSVGKIEGGARNINDDMPFNSRSVGRTQGIAKREYQKRMFGRSV